MSTDALRMRGPVHGTKDAKRVAIGSSVGAVIETYDFIGFGTAAALYFGTAFFPSGDPVIGTLAAFATLGVGFAAGVNVFGTNGFAPAESSIAPPAVREKSTS